MARTRFAPDRGLTTRMLTVMFLLGLLYVAFVGIMIALDVGAVAILVIAGGLLAAQYFFSDKIALFAARAREVTPQEAPELHGLIDRLCAMADMPKPKVAIADTDVPNAFATGHSRKKSVIVVNTGLLRRLTPEELEGVLSHELSHVAHRDVAVMTIASFLGIVAGLVTRMALWGGMMGGGRRDNNAMPVFLIVMLVSAVVYAISYLLTLALSRYRELAADRAGALLTGRPSALASALQKITGDMARIPSQDLRKQEMFNAFYFAPAFSKGLSLSTLFSSHPPLDKRLEQLGRISAQIGRGE